MNVVYRKISALKPYKKNAKKHDKKQVEQIAESIKQFGFTQPVLIDKDNNVVAGHGRILGAKKAGLKEVPTVMLDDLTEEQIKAYRLVDNKLNESAWDLDLLQGELFDLKDIFDMPMFGFSYDMSDEEIETYMQDVEFQAGKKVLCIVGCRTQEEAERVKKEIEHLGYKCDIKEK